MSLNETVAFFDCYQAAFNALDGDAVAELWAAQSGIADRREGRARLTWWSDAEAMRDNHRALCEADRASGFARAAFELGAFTAFEEVLSAMPEAPQDGPAGAAARLLDRHVPGDQPAV